MTAVPVPSTRWEAGERLFRGDDRWIGGDDAYSVALGDDRRLWLFGDTFIARTPGGGRGDAHFINNSIAIQHGSVAAADMEFLWGGTQDAPEAFFGPPPGGGVYRWPGHGVLIDDTLLLFFMLVRDAANPPDGIETLTFFEVVGWDAVTVDVRAHPRDWTPRDVALPSVPFARLVGNGGVFADGRFVHAHAWTDGTVHLARWPVDQVVRGDLRQPQWWCGEPVGWLAPGAVGFAPTPTLSGVETEFTVHWEPSIARYVHTQLPGLGDARLELRTAPTPCGPWSEPTVAFRPEAEHRSFCYAGKAHPGLAPDGLAVTFNSIPFTLAAIRERPELYLPRVVRVPLDTQDNLL